METMRRWLWYQKSCSKKFYHNLKPKRITSFSSGVIWHSYVLIPLLSFCGKKSEIVIAKSLKKFFPQLWQYNLFDFIEMWGMCEYKPSLTKTRTARFVDYKYWKYGHYTLFSSSKRQFFVSDPEGSWFSIYKVNTESNCWNKNEFK